jgi:hypothetical protein
MSTSTSENKEGLRPLPTTEDRITSIVRGNSILNLISGLEKAVDVIDAFVFDDDDQKVLDGVNDVIEFLTELMRAKHTSTHDDCANMENKHE